MTIKAQIPAKSPPHAAELQRMTARLPHRVGLCPEHALEFYYPLLDGESLACPECSLDMVVYERSLSPTP